MTAGTPIRWDVVEEHLDEAAFLRQLWEEALRSPDYALAEIADGPEGRMRAHLDGLVVGGARVARKLLLPAIAGEEPGPAFAAAFALLSAEDGDFVAEVLDALARAPAGARAALRRALAVVPRDDLVPRLAAVAAARPELQLDLLEVLAYLCQDGALDPRIRLEGLAASGEPGAEARAVRLAGAAAGRLDPLVVERALASSDPDVRAAALEVGMATGLRGAFAAAEATVAERGPGFAAAALVLGLSGDARSVEALRPALSEPDHARSAAFGLGFSGRVEAADALLAAMADEALAPAAAEGFAAVTGLAISKAFARPPERWNPEAAGEGEERPYGPEADLPRPAPEAVAAWWKEAREKLDPSQRWLRGRPWGAEPLLRELEQGPARRREGLALDLLVRTRGQARVAWDALAARQRRELEAARGAAGRLVPRAYRDAR